MRTIAAEPFPEIACDESGSDGENLMGGNTDVFAHAGVAVATGTAARRLAEIRRLVRSPAREYKANHLLRAKHRPVLEWLLGPDGPLLGHAQVHLTDKAFFVVGKVTEVLLPDGDAPADLARVLYRAGRAASASAPGRWRRFLVRSNDLLRLRSNGDDPVASFLEAAAGLRTALGPGPAAEPLRLLAASRARAEAFRARLSGEAAAAPALDPLLPALVSTARHWSAPGRPVALVHDRQSVLTQERVARLCETAGVGSLVLVDSLDDPRVQLADFLAGAARKIASDELNGRGDAVLSALLRPYVDPGSVWADEPSWARLRG
ncbi:DUF3800 domain-containing protein [Streptomyces sp. YIM 98790]|uniref:DUF3800 domain-containing protein n=1 Tax=Streptomyces sp. YIM 98790 TaxID=2689077 RepID=UPI00140A5A91|nr:DUF3800 domain-containing protein [Streptomyces sp. YIM 98790]